MNHELAILPVDLGVDDRVLGDFVEVVGVVRRVLISPLDLAVGGAEREHARRPLVVAGAVFGVPIRAGIADALVERVGVGIVGGGFPDRAAAVLPALLAVLPGLVAGLASARDGVGAPERLAGVEIGRVDIAANAIFAAGGADDRDVADHQRRKCDRLGDGGVGDLALPDLLSGRLVEREHPPVEGDRDNLVLPQRHAAVVDAAAGDVARPGAVDLWIEAPAHRAPGAAADIDGIDPAPAVRHIHHAVLDDRRGFHGAELTAAAALVA